MNEEEFISAIDSEVNDRLQYGDLLGSLKTLFMDMARSAVWLQEAVQHWSEVDEDLLPAVGASIEQLNDNVREHMVGLLELIQKNAKYLYGEEFPQNSFHQSNCECENHHEPE